MYKTFEVINQFVQEISGYSIFEKHMPFIFQGIEELKNAYVTLKAINESARKPYSNEFVRDVYPILEVAVEWEILKKSQGIPSEFMKICKTRVAKTQQNYYGTIFEIAMATRCLLSNWTPKFVEDYTVPEKQIDFVFDKKPQMVGVECLSKRYSESSLTIDKLNKDISEKGQKFKPEYIQKLDVKLDKRIVIIDITMSSYSKPRILMDLEKTKLSSNLDAVIYTWTEDITENENHSLRTKYKTYGHFGDEYFGTSFATEFHVHSGEPVLFIRKYTEPEPTIHFVGTEERLQN